MQREIRCCDHPRYGKCDCGAEGIPAPPTNERKECCCGGKYPNLKVHTPEQCYTEHDLPTSPIEEREIEGIAMNIVHQIGDALYDALPPDVAHEYFVKARQATNDIAIDFAAKQLNRKYIGIEREKEYVEIAEARLKATPSTLF